MDWWHPVASPLRDPSGPWRGKRKSGLRALALSKTRLDAGDRRMRPDNGTICLILHAVIWAQLRRNRRRIDRPVHHRPASLRSSTALRWSRTMMSRISDGGALPSAVSRRPGRSGARPKAARRGQTEFREMPPRRLQLTAQAIGIVHMVDGAEINLRVRRPQSFERREKGVVRSAERR